MKEQSFIYIDIDLSKPHQLHLAVYSDRLWIFEGGERRILFYSQKVLKTIMIVRIEMMKFMGSRLTYLYLQSADSRIGRRRIALNDKLWKEWREGVNKDVKETIEYSL